MYELAADPGKSMEATEKQKKVISLLGRSFSLLWTQPFVMLDDMISTFQGFPWRKAYTPLSYSRSQQWVNRDIHEKHSISLLLNVATFRQCFFSSVKLKTLLLISKTSSSQGCLHLPWMCILMLLHGEENWGHFPPCPKWFPKSFKIIVLMHRLYI